MRFEVPQLNRPQQFMLATFGIAAGAAQVAAGLELPAHLPQRGFMVWWGGFTLLQSMILLAQLTRLWAVPIQ